MRSAVLASLLSVAAVAVAPARADPLSDCAGGRGTIEAVDFGHWGGPIVLGCAVDQRSGYALMHATGFTTAGDAEDGFSFICRIGQRAFDNGVQFPTASEDACIATPPASAYWSYWLAEPGTNSWIYSPLGPLDDVPKSGEIELWSFGSTAISGKSGSGVPPFSPASLRAPAAKHVGDLSIVTAEATGVHPSSGSAAGVIVGAVVAAALVSAAGWAAWRRRHDR